MHDLKILEGAEEFSFERGPVGALLVHGFTGSPQGMRPLGEYLAERDASVVGVRLPGHGTSWEDLSTRTAEDWIGAAEQAFHQLVATKHEVYLVGLSFGAALCLDLAGRYPDSVAGIVALAPWVMTKDPRRFLAPVIRRVTRSVAGVGNDIADPVAREIVYDRVPTRAAHLMLRYCKRCRFSLPAVRSPVLIMHSKNDHTAHPGNARLIHATVSSEDKELVWLNRSYHVITLDVDRDEVYERTFRFIKDHSRYAF